MSGLLENGLVAADRARQVAPQYDMADMDVREMVRHAHRPHERRDREGYMEAVECRRCGEGWPCGPVAALRLYEEIAFGKAGAV